MTATFDDSAGVVSASPVTQSISYAEEVFFLKDLSVAGQLRWLPALHKAVVGTGKLTINELQSLSCRQRQVEKQ